MNLDKVDKLIDMGYNGYEISDIENCIHDFIQFYVYSIHTGETLCFVCCKHCGLDSEAALVIGIDPKFLNSWESEELV